MTFTPLALTEVDPKSPIDDTLIEKIKYDLDDLDSRVTAAGSAPFNLEVIGRLSFLNTYPQKRSLAGMILSKAFIPTICRYGLKKSGLTGSMTIDLRKVVPLAIPITGIDYQYLGTTTAIARAGAGMATQNIARAATQIATQSITHAKASNNIQSIIQVTDYELGSNLWQYNLASTIDSDTIVGDSIVMSGCTNGANNGTFVIVDVNRSGGKNVVVTNASGVAQTTAAGAAQIKIMSYNQTNPVDPFFVYGALFASHTDANNNNTFAIYKINQDGNNIWVKNPAGVTQGGAVGTVDCISWKYNFTSPASTTDYVVGETVYNVGHTTAGNNQVSLIIVAVNSGGDNLIIYNPLGAVQAGVAGGVYTNRFVYSMASNPAAQVTAGDTMYFYGHTSSLMDGIATVKEVNRASSNNLVISVPNGAGVAQPGAAGYALSTKKLIKFASDQSAYFTTDSYIEMLDTQSAYYNANDTLAPFRVLEINRGGGANYNVVIDSQYGPYQLNDMGFVACEMKSVFTSAPVLNASATAQESNLNISGSTTSLIATSIPANTPINLYVTNAMTGDPRDLTVSLF